MSEIIFVFNPSTGHIHVNGPVMRSILPQQRIRNNQVKVVGKKQNNSFSTMLNQLAQKGLYISEVRRNTGPEVVIFKTGPKEDANAKYLFRQFTNVAGWEVVRYDNPDKTTVFAAKSPFWTYGSDAVERLNSIFYGDDYFREGTPIQL